MFGRTVARMLRSQGFSLQDTAKVAEDRSVDGGVSSPAPSHGCTAWRRPQQGLNLGLNAAQYAEPSGVPTILATQVRRRAEPR